MRDLIERQAAIDAINEIINRFERILQGIRESKVDDSVCGMCEYDGAYIGQSGDWCNECPGFEKNNCFKLSDKCRTRWLKSVELPSAQPDPEWIPCSEELPDELAEVNVTWENTEPEPYYDFMKGHCFTGTAVYFRGRWYWYSAVCVDYLGEYGFSPNDEMDDAIKVLAWKPLPEPYKEGEQDD